MDRERFVQALESESIEEIQKVPKSDLHSHAGRGGRLSYIEHMLHVHIPPLSEPLNSLHEMDEWFKNNVKCHFPDRDGYVQRIAAAFVQAKADNIALLAMSYGMSEIDSLCSLELFAAVMNGLHTAFAPETRFMPDLFLYSSVDLDTLDALFSANWFAGIDLCNYANTMSMDDMKAMSRKAHEHQLIVKAHVGEFGGADDVLRYAEELALDQIQHGIAAAESPQIMNWLAKHKVQLNVCPTSNKLLRNAKSYQAHPIRVLFDYGIPVTINTDDLLIFDATASQEYLNLYHAGLMTADELNIIRETGLSSGGEPPTLSRPKDAPKQQYLA